MTYHWIIPLVAALASLGLGVLVLINGPRTSVRGIFTLTSVTLAFWNLIYVVFYSVSDHDLAYELARIVRSGAMFLFPAILHLVIALPGRPRRAIIWRLLALDYVVFAGLIVADAFNLLIKDLRVVGWGYYSVGTPLYDFFSLAVLANFAAVFVFLIHEYRTTAEPRMRLQLKFWLFGLAVALPLGLTNLLPAYGVPFYPLGNLGSVAWAGIVAYAIVRHRLMDIEVVISKGIAYMGVTLLLVGPAFVTALTMQRLAFGEVHYDFSAGIFLLLVMMGVLFPVLRSWTEARVERSLFPQKQEGRETLAQFGRSVMRILDNERLVRELCETVAHVFDVDDVALFMLEDVRGKFELRRSLGTPPSTAVFPAEHPFARCLAQRVDAVLRHEIEFGGTRGTVPQVLTRIFAENRWEVCVPFVSGANMIGFLALGRRRDMAAFAVGDLEILSSVAAQASIALENARLYGELRRSREIISRAGRLSALGTLAAGIAHEIRNPLVSIQTFFQLAPQRLDDEEFMTSFLRLAEAEVQRISDLISELLTFAKSPSASLGQVDVNEIVTRTSTLLAPQARRQQVELRQTLAKDLDYAAADADQVLQVLINIVLNGIQATPAGGVVAIETRQVDTESGFYCQIEVRDTGEGIPAQIREAIFNPFFTTKDKGTGLGLPIAHQIVTECGGFITVESEEGRGTQFSVNLPVFGRGEATAADTLPAKRLTG